MILLPPFKGTQVKSRRQVYLNDKEERAKNLSSMSSCMENKEPQVVWQPGASVSLREVKSLGNGLGNAAQIKYCIFSYDKIIQSASMFLLRPYQEYHFSYYMK